MTEQAMAGNAELIANQVLSSIDRIVLAASGIVVDANLLPINTQNKVYAKAPHLIAIQYILDQALGLPGAEITCFDIKKSHSYVHQSAFDKSTGTIIDYSELMYRIKEKFADALPIAIERLKELCTGISILHEHKSKKEANKEDKLVVITLKPNRQAIETVAARTLGKSNSVLGDLTKKFENPETDSEVTADELAKLTPAEYEVYRGALYLKSEIPEPLQDPIEIAREQELILYPELGDEAPLPKYVQEAETALKSHLPVAMQGMKILASGAQTIIKSVTERRIIQHEPDIRANAFFVNRFLGKPASKLRIENIVEKSKMDLELERLSVKYPDVVEKHGSIGIAITNYINEQLSQSKISNPIMSFGNSWDTKF